VSITGNNSRFTMSGGLISSNTANGDLNGNGGGGGVYMSLNTFEMTGGEITDNNAPNGGGLFRNGGGTFNGNPQIGGTTAPASGGWIHGNTPNDVGP
jgi:hypothetical protein